MIKLIPKTEVEALDWLVPILNLRAADLSQLYPDGFKRAWSAVAFLYPGLHPDEALNHGRRILDDHPDYPLASARDKRLINPYFERSGWPVILALLAKEARVRYRAGVLTADEFYGSDSQRAGMIFRNPALQLLEGEKD